ncbi:MAG TPA: hypothetical protein PKC23_09635 [Candidatus Desulfobacillus sp.]|nr:hypothetical protein [Candidatus Desulfobacillus sp.]
MNPVISAILSSIIDSILESAMAPQALPPPAPPTRLVQPSLENGMVATMSPPNNGLARFNDKEMQLSASLQIRDINNRLILPMSLQQPVPVLYKLDLYGTVQRVWVLTPEEAEIAEELIRQKKQARRQQQ